MRQVARTCRYCRPSALKSQFRLKTAILDSTSKSQLHFISNYLSNMNFSIEASVLNENRSLIAREYWKTRMNGYEPVSCFRIQSAGYDPSRRRELRRSPSTYLSELVSKFVNNDGAKRVLVLCVSGILAHKFSAHTDICLFLRN